MSDTPATNSRRGRDRHVPGLDADALALLAAQAGLTVDQLRNQVVAASAPLVADHIEAYLARQTRNTRDLYATHLGRFRDGVGPVCDQLCEPCIDRAHRFMCRCQCTACNASRLTSPPHGHERVGAAVYSREHAELIVVIAYRLAVKRGAVANRQRAARGQPPKMADGYGAKESAVGAMRSLYDSASAFCGGVNAALEIRKPRRMSRERRPMEPFEIVELHHLTSSGGNDPTLDTLLLDVGIATGARREGVTNLTVGQIHRDTQMIDMRDKYKRTQPVPVSLALIDRLLAHAQDRGGAACDPTDTASYRSEAPVFYYHVRDGWAPITERRIDYLAARWQRDLPWAAAEQVGYHHLRHSMASLLSRRYGAQHKKRYLRHADGNVTDGYGVCTVEQLAAAMADLLAFEHPLVHGLAERRRNTLARLGMPDH
jgi:integrase